MSPEPDILNLAAPARSPGQQPSQSGDPKGPSPVAKFNDESSLRAPVQTVCSTAPLVPFVICEQFGPKWNKSERFGSKTERPIVPPRLRKSRIANLNSRLKKAFMPLQKPENSSPDTGLYRLIQACEAFPEFSPASSLGKALVHPFVIPIRPPRIKAMTSPQKCY
jgi:hypothetical protein